ncbi:diacylglycerol/lipid kinase family protein [Blastococcus haudaquaticus]|uniref:Lipid kinase, YegS/Rv2252/BmrU family n=1 Tax=Blastococcus haudaquaticus TaxID=1938745 RepID=A0A286GSE0_9ACTN|nr:diacylglycerol kinase family protein [Blastococcus haudaquaticus]SOD98106.1 lipid kinase, YegS/Rv2252/BmrU family [Blastococcus haudaquaticus]
MQGLLVVVNRAAGTTDDDAVDTALTALRAGADVEVAATGDEAELLEALAARDGRRVVVVGGDGSVHAVVQALVRTGALDPGEPVGIIPRGTGNDLARTLGLPEDPAEAAAVILTGRARPLDLVRDDAGGVVVNAVHLGVGAEAGAEAVRFKERLGTVAFPLGAAVAGLTSSGWPMRVEVDGRVAGGGPGAWTADGTTDVLMVAVCTGRTIGGGAPLAPDALPDDGLAEVVVSTATGPVARAAFATALLTGRHVERDDVSVTRGREVTVTGPPVPLNADGELESDVTARTWHVQPSAWSVLVPDGASGGLSR